MYEIYTLIYRYIYIYYIYLNNFTLLLCKTMCEKKSKETKENLNKIIYIICKMWKSKESKKVENQTFFISL